MRLIGRRPPGTQLLEREHQLDRIEHRDHARKARGRQPAGEADEPLARLSQLEAGAACPSCGEHLEVALRTDDIRTTAPSGGGVVYVETCGYQVQARVPTSADLLAAVGHVAESAHAALLRRCVFGIRQADDEVDAATLPDAVAQAVIRELAARDPQAEVLLSLRCPACEHEWSTPFDILAYLWDEIDDWARRLLSEVHTLASAYGWSERDVLGMSARRRRLYLEMSEAWG